MYVENSVTKHLFGETEHLPTIAMILANGQRHDHRVVYKKSVEGSTSLCRGLHLFAPVTQLFWSAPIGVSMAGGAHHEREDSGRDNPTRADDVDLESFFITQLDHCAT